MAFHYLLYANWFPQATRIVYSAVEDRLAYSISPLNTQTPTGTACSV
jgi:hypothetical protein